MFIICQLFGQYHFFISLYLFINIACDDTLWKRVNLGGKSVPCGVIGQLFARGLRYLRLSNATLSSPLMRNKYGYTYNVIHPNKLVRILKYVDICIQKLMHIDI